MCFAWDHKYSTREYIMSWLSSDVCCYLIGINTRFQDEGRRSVLKSGGGTIGGNRLKVSAGSASLLGSEGVVRPPKGSGAPKISVTREEKWSRGAQ